jgi:DNA (cytosine-5)-methyltransferase 1
VTPAADGAGEEDLAPVPPDPCGWTAHPAERRDFFNRIRAFPPDVAAWRRRMLEHVRSDPGRYPAVGPLDGEQLTAALDSGISYLREVARILAVLYGNPELGNKADPTDELVYILLARHTREGAYQQAFEALKQRFRTWDELLDAPREEVERLVYSGGLSGKKSVALRAALGRLRETFGHCTLEPAREWSDERLEEFLCSLPEVQRKSAYCIMMYSFGRQVFPADTHVGRVLARLGPYRELGLDLTGLDHKKLQRVLTDLIPPPLRHSLHVNLVQHGRDVCQKLKPLCQQCELRNFCSFFRRKEAARVSATRTPTVVDLFAGAGGLSEGFTRAGFRVLAALDLDPMAVRTYGLNHPAVPDDRVLMRDIQGLKKGELKRLMGAEKVDVLCGSPPCQGFSSVGFRSKQSRLDYRLDADDRNFLFEHMVRLALELRPALFLMENVPGTQTARKKEDVSFLEAAARMLQEQGRYRTEVWRLNACAFGVPQDRARCFLVASRLDTMPARPPEDYQDPRRRDADLDALPPVTLQEAIFDLPPRAAAGGVSVDERAVPDVAADLRFRRYLSKFNIFRPSRLLYQHTVRYHNPRDLELYALLRPGEDSIHVLEQHGRTDLMRYRRDVFDDKYARLRGDRPCKTIVAHLAKDGNGYIHPTQVRSLSFREAARVQSFHDRYVFCGSPSEQWIQLGNAVPPVLAEAIARTFRLTLERS